MQPGCAALRRVKYAKDVLAGPCKIKPQFTFVIRKFLQWRLNMHMSYSCALLYLRLAYTLVILASDYQVPPGDKTHCLLVSILPR